MSEQFNYDVIFLGSGHAAWHAALTLKQANKSVAIIEKDKIAGTCTNYGCNAKILLEGPYEILEAAESYPNIINQEQLSVNWENLMSYKQQVISPLSGTLEHMFTQYGIDVYHGAGSLVSEHLIEVNEQQLTADYIVLATGQHSNKLPIEGTEHTFDSRNFLSLEHFPKHMTIIGAGIIGIEFASIAIKNGSEVTIIHHTDEALTGFNRKHVDKLIDKLANEGVQFHLEDSPEKLSKTDAGYIVTTAKGESIQTDYVLDSTGRRPNVEGIGLEKLGIEYSAKGIQVDEYLRTNVPNIYASGDVLDKAIPKLTPTATFESNYIAAHILGMTTSAIAYPAIPSVLYSLPRLAQIGVTVEEAKQNEDQYTIKTIPFGKQLLFEYKNETTAEMDIVLDSQKHLVGAEIYANDAPDLINLLTFIVNKQITAQELNQMVFAFPGSSSGVLDLLKMNMM